MNDDELLNYLFNEKLVFSFYDLYNKIKVAHPNIKRSFVREWLNKQQGIQMSSKKVTKKEK